jgi:hypothetical protein
LLRSWSDECFVLGAAQCLCCMHSAPYGAVRAKVYRRAAAWCLCCCSGALHTVLLLLLQRVLYVFVSDAAVCGVCERPSLGTVGMRLVLPEETLCAQLA